MNVFECADKDGVPVRCAEEAWNNHILGEHPEMKGCEAIVAAAIEDPYEVYQDAVHPDTKIIYKPFVLPKPFNTVYLRVAIKYRKSLFGKERGWVKTAFPCQNKRKGDVLIWPKEK